MSKKEGWQLCTGRPYAGVHPMPIIYLNFEDAMQYLIDKGYKKDPECPDADYFILVGGESTTVAKFKKVEVYESNQTIKESNMIEFKTSKMSSVTIVKLDGEIVGEIREVEARQYFPRGSKTGGALFHTEEECRKSLL